MQRDGARRVDCLFPLIGHIYAAAGHYFGPYKKPGGAEWDLGVAGKLMAYIGLGSVDEGIVSIFQDLYQEHFAGDSELALSYRGNIRAPEGSLKPIRNFSRLACRDLRASFTKTCLPPSMPFSSAFSFMKLKWRWSAIQSKYRRTCVSLADVGSTSNGIAHYERADYLPQYGSLRSPTIAVPRSVPLAVRWQQTRLHAVGMVSV